MLGLTTLGILLFFKLMGKRYPDYIIFSFGPVLCIIMGTIMNYTFSLTQNYKVSAPVTF
jgi:MFS superfamily sulfate permease-like transporter